MKNKYSLSIIVLLLVSGIYYSTIFSSEGALGRMSMNPDTLLAQKGTEQFLTIQKLIKLYGPFAAKTEKDSIALLKSQNLLSTLLSDGATLLEGFFAHIGMLLELPLFAAIDSTFQKSIDPTIFFDKGLIKPVTISSSLKNITPPLLNNVPPPIGAIAASNSYILLPQVCASLFNASRYVRILTNQIGVLLNPADLCVGAIIINNGWVCSVTMPSLNADKVQQKGGLFCLPAGVSGQNIQGEILGFVKNQTIEFIPFGSGVDYWTAYNNARSMKLVVANDVGATAFVASQLGNGVTAITLQITDQGLITINDAQNNVMSQLNLNGAVENFYNTLVGPWAVLIEMNNQNFSEGDLFPTFQIKGLIKVNYFDFPLQFQATNSQKIGYPFSLQSIFSAPNILFEEMQGLSGYTQGVLQNNFTYGACKDYSINVSLPIFKKNNLYVDPINTGIAKVKGALLYDWETQKYTMQDALQGINNILSTLFFRRQNITPTYIFNNLKSDPNVLLI